MEQPNAIRRQQLQAWRESTGRTPMKRLSYVQECFRQSPSTEKVNDIQSAIQRSRFGQDKNKVLVKPGHRKGGSKRENVPPKTPRPVRVTVTPASQKHKLTRREMLDQWLAVHGSTVKRSRSVLGTNTALNQRGACTEARPKPVRNQSCIRPCSLKRLKNTGKNKLPFSPRTLKSLKEEFQRDIEETVAEIRENEGDPYSPSNFQDTTTQDRDGYSDLDLARGLDYNEWEMETGVKNTPTISHKVKCRRSIAHADPNLIFHSSTIRYSMALSEPRKRRNTMSGSFPEDRLVYLTPVRRSTRKNRHCPGLLHDQDLCFDSPGQLAREERYHDTQVEIVPNLALDYDV